MRKKDLLAMPKLLATKQMMQKAINDVATKAHAPQYTRYYRAIQQGEILKVAIWRRTSLISGRKEPDFEVYIDKANDKWMNYNVSAHTWGEARIENLQMGYPGPNECDWYGVRGYETDACRKLVNKYLGSNVPNLLVRDAIKNWQKNIADASLCRRYQSELEHIDSVMNLVPELPKDFEKWAQTEAYYHSQYMIYDRKAKKARCTNCWEVVPALKEYKHGAQVKCPICKLEVECKSWNKQYAISDRKKVGIIQPLKDGSGYIQRVFDTQIRYPKDGDYSKDWWIHEDYRFLLTNDFDKIETFEWGEYKRTGRYRWCHEIPHGMYYYDGPSTECILYHRNIKRMISTKEKLKYIPMAEIVKAEPGTYCYPNKIFRNATMMPQVEMLFKVGLKRLTMQYLNDSPYGIKKWNKQKPWSYLGITKEYMQLAVSMDAKERHIDVMRVAAEQNVMLTEEQVEFYAKYFRNSANEILALGHTEKMYKYLQELAKQNGNRGISDYWDYIDDLRKLRMPLSKANLFPKNFEAEHRELAEIRRDHENKLAAMELRKKNREFRKLLPEVRKLYECEDDEFKIIIPTCKKDFQDEGREQHNCVGGSYFDRMLRGECVVVFLREKTDPKKSYCTVEFSPEGTVRQNRAIYNREAPEEAQTFINKLSAKVKKAIKKQIEAAAKKADKEAAVQVLAFAT